MIFTGGGGTVTRRGDKSDDEVQMAVKVKRCFISLLVCILFFVHLVGHQKFLEVIKKQCWQEYGRMKAVIL